MRVLAIGAHPDDIEILCGGTLARCKARGDAVVMGVVTDGSAGHMVIPPDELAQVRRRETQAAADLLGAELIWLGLRDQYVYDTEEQRLKVAEMIRQARPDIIITHTPDDYHPDHVNVAKLVFDASFLATLPNIRTASPAHPVVAPIYHMDSLGGVRFQPEEFVDVTEQWELKRRLLACHESQIRWLKDHDNVDVFDFMETVGRYRGLQSNVRYAEAFRRLAVWPRMGTTRHLP